jgi:hypothetical protein
MRKCMWDVDPNLSQREQLLHFAMLATGLFSDHFVKVKPADVVKATQTRDDFISNKVCRDRVVYPPGLVEEARCYRGSAGSSLITEDIEILEDKRPFKVKKYHREKREVIFEYIFTLSCKTILRRCSRCIFLHMVVTQESYVATGRNTWMKTCDYDALVSKFNRIPLTATMPDKSPEEKKAKEAASNTAWLDFILQLFNLELPERMEQLNNWNGLLNPLAEVKLKVFDGRYTFPMMRIMETYVTISN